jgi:cytochrome c-type protein NapB
VRSSGPRPAAVALGLFLVASAATAVAATVVAARRMPASRPTVPAAAPLALLVPPSHPIPAEADVFRTTPAMLAIDPDVPRSRTAHPRNWVTYRYLRAYPGAPPRIPHALSPDEFRVEICNSCHERGGYSLRFAAYVPLTPHPEMGMCLQCHAGDDAVMGTASAGADPNARCPLCHGPTGGRPLPEAAATWSTSVWPTLASRSPGLRPPSIPHALQFRGNCLACHGGPAAVAAIRTSHPERASCRQCHATVEPEADIFVRPDPEQVARAGAAP